MIYCLNENSLIKIVKSAKEIENSYLLYSISGVPLDRIKTDLRFWKRLDLQGDWYKDDPGLHDYFKNHGWIGKQEELHEIDTTTRDAIIDDFISTAEDLQIVLPQPSMSREIIIYECDVYNFLYTWVGVETCNLILDFYELDGKQQEFILSLQNLSGKSRLKEKLEEGLSEFGEESRIYQFYPAWFKFNHKILGTGGVKTNKNLRPEFKNYGRLDKWKNFDTEARKIIREEVFKKFEVGKVYTGKYIKSEMQKIYDTLEIEKLALIKDIFEYFDISKFNLTESEYRIVTRKTA